MTRERWGSRLLFIFAAVGSAAGLGNLWRFPYLAYKYGGGAFLIPYLIILFVIGIPLLLLEFAIGQRFQRGAVESLFRVNRNFSGVGMMGILAAFVIVGYYAVVIAWAVLFLVSSFKVSWAGNEVTFFFNEILNISDSIGDVGSVQTHILIALLVVWIGIYFSIFKGARSASKVVMVTMPLPVLLVVILAIRGVTLGDGSAVGVEAYLIPNIGAVFTDVEVWNAAISQIFFTLTLGFGTMIAYGSYNEQGQELVKSTYWTVFLNSSISIIAGFAIFGTIGYMSYNLAVEKEVPYQMVMEYQKSKNISVFPELSQEEAKDKTITYKELESAGFKIGKRDVARYNLDHSRLSGPGLAFVVYPKAIAMFKPKWIAAVFGVLFFLTLLTLGIDSAFSLVEAISTVIADEVHRRSTEINRSMIAFLVCFAGFLSGIIYSTRGGLYFLDIVDHYITSYGLVLVGLLQAIALGWFYNIKEFRAYINSTTDLVLGRWWEISVKYIAPILLLYIFINQLGIDLKTPYENYPSWAQIIGWLAFGIPLLIGLFVTAYMRMVTRAEE